MSVGFIATRHPTTNVYEGSTNFTVGSTYKKHFPPPKKKEKDNTQGKQTEKNEKVTPILYDFSFFGGTLRRTATRLDSDLI